MSETLENKINEELGRRAPNGQRLLTLLFTQPALSIVDVAQKLEVSKQTAHTLTQDFEKLKIIREKTGNSRNRVFVFEQYLNLFEKTDS